MLSLTINRKVPPWPLAGDVGQAALLEVTKKKVTALRADLKACQDGRARGRLQRQLDRLGISTAKLEAEIKLTASAERSLWADLWAMPQAEIWAESHAHREVAQYVRWKVRAENGSLDAGKEARMLSDRLGLNPLALLRLRTEIEQVDKAQHEGARRRAGGRPETGTKKAKDLADPRRFLSAVHRPE